jgi:hypothetical protein
MSQYCPKQNGKEIIYDQSTDCDYYKPIDDAPSWVSKPKPNQPERTMKLITTKQNIIFGVKDMLPLSGFPKGKVKIKMRNDNFAWAYVKTETGIYKYAIEEKNGCWMPSLLACNFRTTNPNEL